MELYFKNSQDIRRSIASNVKDKQEALKIINKFCKERNFEIYYIRTWTQNDEEYYDVGSHTEFFILHKERDGLQQ